MSVEAKKETDTKEELKLPNHDQNGDVQDDKDENKNDQNEEQVDDSHERSIFVKNVDFKATPEELKDHFKECGAINRVTLLMDKMTGQPKGHAYIEFTTREGVEQAKKLDESLFRGRQLTVMPKRKNLPGRGRGVKQQKMQQQLLQTMMMVFGRGRGRGGRGGRGRGGNHFQ